MATSACARRHEPCYKQHTAVDDARGVVVDVAVTTGAVSESRMIEAQVDAVRETTGRAIGTVTADAGYAYSKVFGGLERRRIDPVIPTRKDPSRSPVPLRRFRYDARHHLVRCPRGKILQPSDLMPAGLPRRLARVKRLRSSSMVSRGGLLLLSDTISVCARATSAVPSPRRILRPCLPRGSLRSGWRKLITRPMPSFVGVWEAVYREMLISLFPIVPQDRDVDSGTRRDAG